MKPITPAGVREYLAGLRTANAFEIEELRSASPEFKLRQLWSLMSSAQLFQSDASREVDVLKVRERWARIYQTLCD